MAAGIPIWAALAGATAGTAGQAIANRRSAKRQSSFHGRMQAAEQYGIHPLQAIGSAGSQMGTGGLQIGQMLRDATEKGFSGHHRQRAEDRQDETAHRQHQYNKEIEQMRIAAADRRWTSEQEIRNRSPNPDSIEGAVSRTFKGSFRKGWQDSRTKELATMLYEAMQDYEPPKYHPRFIPRKD
jgi:hypothetical protein